jgi:Ca2+-transporting ATPase
VGTLPIDRVGGVGTLPIDRVAGAATLPIDRVAGAATPPSRVAEIADGADAPANGHIYARVRPEQKLQLVSELQAAGEVVAMTGDGVNDAPALRRADIGVAMGGGTEVARQAADLVLTDDGLGTILVAVREGRRIYQNIRRFLWYALAGGTAEILVMLLGPFVGLAIPLLPAQILWINLLTHGLPGVALGAEPATPGLMRRPPRSPAESVLGNGLATVIGLTGSLIGAVTLISGLVAHARGWPWQSVLFLTLGLAQLGVALAVRARRTATEPANNALWLAVAVSAVLQVAGVLVAPLRELLGTEWLTGWQLLACVAVAAVPGAVLMVWRHRRLHRRLDLDRDRDLPSRADRDLTDDAGPQPASGPAEGSKVPAVPSARPCPVAADPYQAGTRTKGDPT